jgi:hypothetical protein
VYRKFGLEMAPEFLGTMQEIDDKQKRYKSDHLYSFEKVGISRKQIVSNLRHIFERFGFDDRGFDA